MDEDKVADRQHAPPPPAAWQLPSDLPPTKRASIGSTASTVAQGLFVAISAGLVPTTLAYMIVFTDGLSAEETEGFHYAGLFIFAFLGSIMALIVAPIVWAALRHRLPHATLVFVGPGLILLALLILIVLSRNCLDVSTPC